MVPQLEGRGRPTATQEQFSSSFRRCRGRGCVICRKKLLVKCKTQKTERGNAIRKNAFPCNSVKLPIGLGFQCVSSVCELFTLILVVGNIGLLAFHIFLLEFLLLGSAHIGFALTCPFQSWFFIILVSCVAMCCLCVEFDSGYSLVCRCSVGPLWYFPVVLNWRGVADFWKGGVFPCHTPPQHFHIRHSTESSASSFGGARTLGHVEGLRGNRHSESTRVNSLRQEMRVTPRVICRFRCIFRVCSECRVVTAEWLPHFLTWNTSSKAANENP